MIQIQQEQEFASQKDWRSRKLNHKYSDSTHVQVGLQQHLSFQILNVLKATNNVAAVAY